MVKPPDIFNTAPPDIFKTAPPDIFEAKEEEVKEELSLFERIKQHRPQVSKEQLELATKASLGITMPGFVGAMETLPGFQPAKEETYQAIGQMGLGYGKGLTFGLSDVFVETPKPETASADVMNRIGSLFGFRQNIRFMLTKGPLAFMSRFKPVSKMGVFTKNIARGGLSIGGYSLLSEHGGKDFMDNIQKRTTAGVGGAAIGMAFGAINAITGDVLSKLKIKDELASGTAFIMRLGLNESITGYPAYKRYLEGEENLPGLIYNIGLGAMFSMSGNPLKMEAEFNQMVKRQHHIKNLTQPALVQEIRKLGSWDKIPADIKWAYIMKATNGKVKPDAQTAPSTNQIFEKVLRVKDKQTHDNLKFVADIKIGIEKEVPRRVYKFQREKLMKEREIGFILRSKGKTFAIGDKTSIVHKDINKGDSIIHSHIGKGNAFPSFKDLEAFTEDRLINEYAISTNNYLTILKRNKRFKPFKKWSKGIRDDIELILEDSDMFEHEDPGNIKAHLASFGVDMQRFKKPIGIKNIKKLGIWKEFINIKDMIPEEYLRHEGQLNIEMVTGRDIGTLKRTARAKGLSDNQINKFLEAYTHGDFNLSELKDMPKEKLEGLRQLMKQLTTDSQGKARIPASKAILPLEFFDWAKEKGNIFDWAQTARMPIRKVYDLVKPAYENYMQSRRAKLQELNNIYGRRIKRGSRADQLLAKYADGKINIDDLPKNLRDIATKRRAFYDVYADQLIDKGLLDPKRVFNKDGTRKPYYHRIFEHTLNETAFKAGFALDDIYLPGKMPKPGALKKRTGAWGYKNSAIESDLRYIYGIEKFLNMSREVDAATQYAHQLTGMRKDMANVYIRAMRGQPTKWDSIVKEQLQHIVNETGKLAGSKKLQNWQAPSYPLSRITSPLARFYYWRYVGLAMDTAMKNSIQWHHALARYGPENTGKAMRMQFTERGRQLIKESGIHKESIQRGGHFIEEAGPSKKLNNIEEASYFLWTTFDKNNRNISGLAGYLDATAKGASHPQAIQVMRKASHETQYGYTKADSLLMDLANPASRFILFKKWPLAKVEMIRSWIREGHSDAVFNLALNEYLIFRAAQRVGIDLGPYFSGIWTLATRGIENIGQLIPVAEELVTVGKTLFTKGPTQEKAKERLIRAWQGMGNRWMGKVVDRWKWWMDDWNVRDVEGGLKYKITPGEAMLGLFAKPLAQTKRQEKIKRMLKISDDIKAIKKRILFEIVHGDQKKAADLQQELLNRYGEEYSQEFGKILKPVTVDEIMNYVTGQEVPVSERIRKRLPGKGLLPSKVLFPGKAPPPNIFQKVRGY